MCSNLKTTTPKNIKFLFLIEILLTFSILKYVSHVINKISLFPGIITAFALR